MAVDNAAFQFDRLYTYAVPAEIQPFARVGARVLVPFGKAAPRMGVILRMSKSDDTAAGLKELLDIERTAPLLDAELVRLIELLRETTFCTYYDAVKTVLPKNSRLVPNASRAAMTAGSQGHLETVYQYTATEMPPRLTEKQRAVCALLRDNPMTAADIGAALGVTRGVVDRLAEKGIVERLERSKEVVLYPAFAEAPQAIPDLTPPQRAALDAIAAYRQNPAKPDTTLLYGVTSSGKTIVYIKLIEQAVADGTGVLVLVPEIALATQMIYRLKGLFGARVAILHSALSDTERQLEWDKIRNGACDIVVGTRSAVFAPVRKLGIIIVDEEQEMTYISEQTPRYAAGQIAAFRAKENGAHLLLSSATPSVESYYKAQAGTYNFVGLGERYGEMPLPEVQVVDMRRELLAGNSHYVSRFLKEEIDLRLARREQSILLLNRRGYRPLSMCNKCKKIVKCEDCDTPLVVHKNLHKYVCHYCNRTYEIADLCDACGGTVKHTGIGTQKIEEDLDLLFPHARILRLDLDTVSRKNAVEKQLYDFSRGEYDIMIGTQMIAKGLDFPNVTLVGVLSIDQLMLMPSYRANERTFAMLTQVVGRSGRGGKTGEAIIQTVDPDNEIIKLAAAQDYARFYKMEILSRKVHLYPPFCAITTVGLIAEKEADAIAAADAFAEIVKTQQQSQHSDMPIRILGPAPMRVAYISKLYRYRVILKHRPGHTFRGFMRACLQTYNQTKHSKTVKVYVDFVGEPDN